MTQYYIIITRIFDGQQFFVRIECMGDRKALSQQIQAMTGDTLSLPRRIRCQTIGGTRPHPTFPESYGVQYREAL